MDHARPPSPRRRRLLARIAAGLLLLLGGGLLALKLYLLSPLAPRQLGATLTARLGQPVSVAGLRLATGGLTLDGVRIDNPPGFDAPPLATVRTIRIVPAWVDLAAGRYRLVSVAVAGVRVALGRNSAGAWNFAGLLRRPKRPGPVAELLVDRLELTDAACSVAGQRIEELSATVDGLATRGSRRTTVAIGGRVAGSRLSVTGDGRLGERPDARFTVTAPTIAVPATVPGAKGVTVHDAGGSLRVQGTLRSGELALDGALTLRGGSLDLKGTRFPVAAVLALRGGYRLADDTATLESLRLTLGGRPVAEASGTVAGVRGERRAEGTVSWQQASLAELFALLPARLGRDLSVAGTLAPGTVRLAGNRRDGVTAGQGRIEASGVTVRKGERLLVSGLVADLEARRVAAGWSIAGEVRSRSRDQSALVEEVSLPLRIGLSSRFGLQTADIASFTGRVAGAPVSGSAGFRPAEREPLRLELAARPIPLREVGRLFPNERLHLQGGSGDLSLRLAGRAPRECRGTFALRVTGLAAASGGRRFAAGSAAIDGEVAVAPGVASATGSLAVDKGEVKGKPFAGSTRYRISPTEFTLSTPLVRLGGKELRAAEVAGRVPKPQRRDVGTVIPLSLKWSGLQGDFGRYGFADCRGELQADLHTVGARRWLDGRAAIGGGRLLSAGATAGTLAADAVLREGEFRAALRGSLMDGRLEGSVGLDPFAYSRGIGWHATVVGAPLARVATLFPAGKLPRAEGGTIDLTWEGGYRQGEGAGGTVRLTGREIALADSTGRGILNDGSLLAVAELAGGNLLLREGSVAVGPDLKVAVSGDLRRAFSPMRSGTFRLTAAATKVNALFDALANRLPRPLQEATVGGEVAAETTIRVEGRAVRVDGILTLGDLLLEMPGQKLTVSGVRGTLPFSLVPSGTGKAPARPTTPVTRDNMAALLADARRRVPSVPPLRVAAVRFGSLEVDDLQLTVSAGEGLTELSSLSATLYGGRVYGNGFFRLGEGERYGGNFILDDVSLRRLCDAFPAIKGYISGRLDGIVSLAGTAPGRDGLVAFVDLWTRNSRDEQMLVSKEFLQKLAGKKLRGFFFRTDRPYDRGEIAASLERGILTFNRLDLSHTNFFGVKDLSVVVATVQNRISLEHLLSVVKEAAFRGKAVSTGGGAPVETEFEWKE